MRQKKSKKGRVIYGGRAFQQDAVDTMRGDITRGLIELITNSDDAYGNEKGKILIEIEKCHGIRRVIVYDRAKGMRAKFMEKAIGSLGGRTSGFEKGADVRGNLGRGAKDLAAFGKVVFESICDGFYAKMTLETTGDYLLEPEKRATDEHRRRLGIKRNGTAVTVFVGEQIRLLRLQNLKEKLSTHYQLRDILSDACREVILSDMGRKTMNTLRYQYPSLQEVFAEELEINGYPEGEAQVTIYRNKERYDDPPSESGRPAGLLLKGGRAIYENSLFSFESNPHAGWFSGVIRCPYIETLAREYDRRLETGEKQDELNPIPIISRRRDSLQRNHPFYKALAQAIEVLLGKLISEEEQKAKEPGAHESFLMRRTLDALGRDLASRH